MKIFLQPCMFDVQGRKIEIKQRPALTEMKNHSHYCGAGRQNRQTSTSSFNTSKDVIIPGKLIASYPLQYPGKARWFSPFLWQSTSFWPPSLGVHRANKAGCNSSNLESSSLKRYVPHLWCNGESSLHFLVRLRTTQDLSLCSLAVNWHVTSSKIILLTMLGLTNSI